jgi:hypothetical protein
MFQSEILELLDSFDVKAASDFYRLPAGQQPYFVRRLYKAFANNMQSIVSEVRNVGGVKFHFRTTGDLSLPNTNLPTETFLKKTAFYANRTIVSFPFKELTRAEQSRLLRNKPTSQWPSKRMRKDRPFLFGEIASDPRMAARGTVAVTGKVYSIDRAAFDDLLTVLSRLRPAIEAGVSQLIPTFPDIERTLQNRRLGLTSANFRLPKLQEQFSEEMLLYPESSRATSGLSHLLLPYFTNIPFERLLEIRERESALYYEFQRYFERLLFESEGTDSETKILGFLRDVDAGVRELHRKFSDIELNYRRKSIYMLVKFLAVGMVLMAPVGPDVQKTIATLVGGMTAFDYLTARDDVAKSRVELRSNRFFLPWLVFSDSKSSLRQTNC